MRRVAAIAAICVAVGLSGCGSPPDPQAGPHLTVGARDTTGAAEAGNAAAGNKAKAADQANRLLGLARVPTGAESRTLGTQALGGPAMGAPEDKSLIDKTRFWYVDEPMSRVAAFLNDLHPHGLTSSGSSTGNKDGDVTNEGFAWSEANRPYAVDLELEIGVVPHGSGSYIRADGVDEWLDPRPTPDTTRGHRLRLIVTDGCPAHDRQAQSVTNSGADLHKRLLPSGAPTAAIICVFGGSNANRVGGLTSSATLSAKDAMTLAARISKVRVSHIDGGVTSCPADDGSAAAIAFSYPGRADVDEWFWTNGCQTIRNGFISVWGGVNLKPWIAHGTDL
jgi:hypothetical protein